MITDDLVAGHIDGSKDTALTAEQQEALAALAAESATQTDELIALAKKDCTLFHDADGVAYASIAQAGHHETHIVDPRAGSFKKWLRRQFYVANNHAPGAQPLKDAIATLEASALFDGIEAEVFLRVGEHDGDTFLDLCNDQWQVVRITPNGWDVMDGVPIYFRRSPGARPLPVPMYGGNIDQLRDFINIESDDDFALVVGWLVAALRQRGPYGIFSFSGEQGSAKSTAMRVLRALIDPNKAPIRSAPRSEEDLIVAATHGWCLTYDNLSTLPVWLSDGLCRISTGGGLGKRTLYTTEDETLFAGQRPTMVNSIEDIIDRDDLRDRSICLTLPTIPDNQRRDEATFWEAFDEAQPAILGALLTLASKAMAELPTVRLEVSPRMADLARVGVAVERAAEWKPGRFLTIYNHNRDEADARAIEDNRIASLVWKLAQEEGVWHGTATALLARLNREVDERVLRSKDWPQSGRGLSGRLRRAAPALRRVGIRIDYHRSESARTISITADTPQGAQQTVTTVIPSRPQQNRDLDGDGSMTVEDTECPTVSQPSAPNTSKNGHNDAHDGNDGLLQTPTIYGADEPLEVVQTDIEDRYGREFDG